MRFLFWVVLFFVNLGVAALNASVGHYGWATWCAGMALFCLANFSDQLLKD